VKEALDLCLSCKGCKSECPVNVDMATYKAEFLAHYYESRLRPVAAYTMGWIHWWSRLAEFAPGVANLFMLITKPFAGIAKERRMPRYAGKTFVERFRGRQALLPVPTGKSACPPRVLLWPDTFNNNFSPDTALAAVEVLESFGYHVTLPKKRVCCGRPLYDWGFLGMAKSVLRETIDALREELDADIPIIGLEPSCISVFRDELLNLFPNDEYAKKLAKSAMTLSEFLTRENVVLPQLQRKALVQAHCHHHAIMKFDAEESVLKKIGLEVEHPDSGCCGMAGAFGFEREKYDVSVRIGERVLLPKVRAASTETLIVADGFSCREQIAQRTNREALHLAQVLQLALRGDGAGDFPERKVIEPKPLFPSLGKALGIAGSIALFAGAVALARKWRK
jgi:Fe-S oxidoreductase